MHILKLGERRNSRKYLCGRFKGVLSLTPAASSTSLASPVVVPFALDCSIKYESTESISNPASRAEPVVLRNADTR